MESCSLLQQVLKTTTYPGTPESLEGGLNDIKPTTQNAYLISCFLLSCLEEDILSCLLDEKKLIGLTFFEIILKDQTSLFMTLGWLRHINVKKETVKK